MKKLTVFVLCTLMVLVVNASTSSAFQLQEPDVEEEGDGFDFPDVDFDPTVLLVIMGLVQVSKEMGVKGNGSLAFSIVLGLFLGGSAHLSTNGTPSDYAGWFGTLIVGLAYGLSTSGIYLVSKTFRPKVGA